jgi:hypothetical protein
MERIHAITAAVANIVEPTVEKPDEVSVEVVTVADGLVLRDSVTPSDVGKPIDILANLISRLPICCMGVRRIPLVGFESYTCSTPCKGRTLHDNQSFDVPSIVAAESVLET